ELVLDVQQDIGFPQWVFGQVCFAFFAQGRVALVRHADGLEHLAVLEPDGSLHDVDLPFTSYDQLRTRGDDVVVVAASASTEPQVVEISGGAATALVPARDLGLDPGWSSVPEPFDFATDGGVEAHALLYRPTNPEVDGPTGE